MTSCGWPHAIVIACEECSWPKVTEVRWYRCLELRSRWRRQQFSPFATACQRLKGKLHFFFCNHDECATCYVRHLPAMSIKTTLHATAPLLYPCRRYPKCPWGLYPSPPPVAMAVVGWFLCFPAFFFFVEKGVFFPHATYAKKKSLRDLHQKKFSVEKKKRLTPKKKKQVTFISTIELRFPLSTSPANAYLILLGCRWANARLSAAGSAPSATGCLAAPRQPRERPLPIRWEMGKTLILGSRPTKTLQLRHTHRFWPVRDCVGLSRPGA